MDKITTLDRAAAKQIGAALEEALQMVAEDLGLNVQIKGGRFDPEVGEFKPKVVFALDGAEEREFAVLAGSFGLKPEDYGRTVSVLGGRPGHAIRRRSWKSTVPGSNTGHDE